MADPDYVSTSLPLQGILWSRMALICRLRLTSCVVQNAEEAAGTFSQYTSHLFLAAVAGKEEDTLTKMTQK